MARRCQVTGKKPGYGSKISHAHNVSKRRFLPNLKKKKYFVPEENRFVTLTVSTHGMKVIDKLGIAAVLRDLRKRGEKLRYGSPKKDNTAVAAKRARTEIAAEAQAAAA